jgi:hypothetical protein
VGVGWARLVTNNHPKVTSMDSPGVSARYQQTACHPDVAS